MKTNSYRYLVLLAAIIVAGGSWLFGPDETIVRASQMSQQPAADQSPPGKAIYEARCTMCHGRGGKGDGMAAPTLNPRPRDFTAGKYKFRSTESGSIPTDADLERTVREGLHGTAMPDWGAFLSTDSLNLVVKYIESLSDRFQNETPKPVRLGPPVAATQSSIADGKKQFEKLQCSSCHGVDGAGKDAVATDLIDDWGYPIRATNLTEPWTFRGGATAQDIYLRFRTGIDGTPMPSFVGSATDKEMWNLANYVVYLGRKPLWEMTAEEVRRHFDALDQMAKADPVAHGRYLVQTMGCADCHTPVNTDGMPLAGLDLAGGMTWNRGPYGAVTSINLTPDKETGIGSWTDEELKLGMTRGIRKDGSRSLPFPMPWTAYVNLKDDDFNAIIAYLRSLPPVYNKIPQPEPLNFFSYLWGKFKMLILKEDFPLNTLPGNAGMTKEKTASMQSGEASGKGAGQ